MLRNKILLTNEDINPISRKYLNKNETPSIRDFKISRELIQESDFLIYVNEETGYTNIYKNRLGKDGDNKIKLTPFKKFIVKLFKIPVKY